nr:MAG TPA: hypothetical protein [Caudoviricetes sp.]
MKNSNHKINKSKSVQDEFIKRHFGTKTEAGKLYYTDTKSYSPALPIVPC